MEPQRPILSVFLPTISLVFTHKAILKTAYEYRFNDIVVMTVSEKMAHFRKGKVVTNAAFHKRYFN